MIVGRVQGSLALFSFQERVAGKSALTNKPVDQSWGRAIDRNSVMSASCGWLAGTEQEFHSLMGAKVENGDAIFSEMMEASGRDMAVWDVRMLENF